jgi:hypothetical protein
MAVRSTVAARTAVAGIPNEMTDAVAQVIEEGHRPAEQQHKADRRNEKRMGGHKQLAAGRYGDEPPNEQDGADCQRDAREPMKDRERRGDLEAIPDREHEGR